MEMIIFVGLPGSGKSTYYKKYFFNTYLRISNDLLRTKKPYRETFAVLSGNENAVCDRQYKYNKKNSASIYSDGEKLDR